MKDIVYPNYDHSILCTISSILKYYGINNGLKTLDCLDDKLNNKYRNVCLIILDGMGKAVLDKVSKNGFFNSNVSDVVTACYPSTTTACLTSYYSGLSPYESGFIAWSQYFKEYGRSLDMLSHKDSYTGELLKVNRDVFSNELKYKSVFDKIEEKGIPAYEVMPRYSDKRSSREVIADNYLEMVRSISDLCSMPGEKFIMGYCDCPDSLLHKYGVNSKEVSEFLLDCESSIEELVKNTPDTLFIITCDHGHKDIGNVYSMNDYPDIKECLIMPESLESRCLTFFVKNDMKDIFEERFNNHFPDFRLFTKKEFLDLNMLGFGNKNKKIDDFLGDYIACSTGNSIIRLQNDYFEGKSAKKSTHCGLTADEMLVPVIIVGEEK